MGSKVLIGGTAYDLKGGKVLVGGTGYSVKQGKTLVSGTGRTISFGTPLSSLAVGTSVYANVNGSRKEFLIVHQGLPSSAYDSSCNGTWLLMKDIYTEMAWDSSDNDYENSNVHTYLNGTFLGLLDSGVQSIIKQVKIPYYKGTGSGGSTATGTSGLSTKIFLLSCCECGWGSSRYLPEFGAKLDYFSTNNAGGECIAYYNGTAVYWWLRTPCTRSDAYVWLILTTGGRDYYSYSQTRGVRPAFILPSGATIDDSYNIT